MKTLIIILISSFGSLSLLSQCEDDLSTITTFWESPESNNEFNWQSSTYEDVYYQNVTTGNIFQLTIEMPMWLSSLGLSSNIVHWQLGESSDPSVATLEKDFQVQDGWELLFKRFGSPEVAPACPSFALYNRHSGIVRVFILVPLASQLQHLNGAYISLSHKEDGLGSRKTALLSTIDDIMQPTEMFNPENGLNVGNSISQENNQWFAADFVVAYDPCTCHLNNFSTMHFDLYSTQTMDLDLEINGEITELSNSSSGGQVLSNDLAFLKDFNDVFKVGAETKEDWGQAKINLDKLLNGTSAFFQSILANRISSLETNDHASVATLSNSGVDFSVILGEETDLTIEQLLLELNSISLTSDDFEEEDLNVAAARALNGQSEQITELVKSLKGFTTLLPHVGTVMGLVDHFNNKNSNETSSSSKSSGPTVSSVDLTVTGDLSGEYKQTDILYITPGSSTATNGSVANTEYDNALGVVHLLKAPEFWKAEYEPSINHIDLGEPLQGDVLGGNQYCENGFPNVSDNKQIVQYKLKSIPQIALNPAANLVPVTAEAAFVFDYTNCNGNTALPAFVEGVRKGEGVFEFGQDIYNNIGSFVERIEQMGMELEYHKGLGSSVLDNFDKLRYRTQYKSLQCLTQESFFLQRPWEVDEPGHVWGEPTLPEIYLKVVFTFEPIANPNELVTIVHTYDLGGALQNAELIGESTYDIDFTCVNTEDVVPTTRYMGLPNGTLLYDPDFNQDPNFWQDLYFNNETITEDVYGAVITIDEGVVIAPGVTVTASEEIVILDENTYNVSFSDNVTFTLLGVPATCDITQSSFASSSQINAICDSQQYTARANHRSNEEIEPEDGLRPTLEFRMYPNPAKSTLFIDLPLVYIDQEISYRIIDLQGKEIQVLNNLSSSENRLFLDISDMSSGMYVFELKNRNGQFARERFIKN